MEMAGPVLIDLSVPIGEEFPCSWPGLPKFAARQTIGAEPPDEYFISRSLTLEEHMGTHVDALNHATIDDSGTRLAAIDALPLERFCGRPRVVDVRNVRGDVKGQSPWILPDAITVHEARTEPIRPGDVVLFWSGWSDEFYQALPSGDLYVDAPASGRAPGWPALHPSSLGYLGEHGVCTIGLDTPSLGATNEALSPHRAAFLAGITPVENLTNIGQVSDGTGLFVFLPLAVRRGTGAPGRAVVFPHMDISFESAAPSVGSLIASLAGPTRAGLADAR